MKNRSPWIEQLNHERPTISLGGDIDTDVAIVGAGIAGITTAFFALKYTDKKIVLLEGGKIAHGATGHNAGQITSYFERPFHEIVAEFGLEKAIDAQKSIDSGWQLLDEMWNDANLDIPISRFRGSAGMVKFSRVLSHLKNDYYRRLGGMSIERTLIADSSNFISMIPAEYEGLYEVVPKRIVLEQLETQDERFIACSFAPKGCMNSALFCQEIAEYLLEEYSEKFFIYEHTHISKIVLKEDHALLDAGSHTILAGKIVLCTNGFENIRIFNKSGLDIDTSFHHYVSGLVGFMSGYLDPLNKPPTAISYMVGDISDQTETEPYFYLTRRIFEHEEKKNHNLISVGGPGFPLDDRGVYASDIDYPEEAKNQIDEFIKKVYENNSNKKIDYVFFWHGLMGYTKNGLRLIGAEPKNPVLLYNLGCNGVGILPSIYGGKRISSILAGESLDLSVFDPQMP